MPKPCPCLCCSGPLEPAQELRYLVECDNLDNPAYLAHIRRLPAVNGRPLPVCHACQDRIAVAPRPVRIMPRPATIARPVNPVRTAVLATVGLLSVGWLFQQLVLGPRA